MNSFLTETTKNWYDDIHAKFEVYGVLRDVIDSVENWDNANKLCKANAHLKNTKDLNSTLLKGIRAITKKNKDLENELNMIKTQAKVARENFVSEIGPFMSDSKHSKKLKDTIKQLEEQLEIAIATSNNQTQDEAEETRSSATGETETNTIATVVNPLASETTTTITDNGTSDKVDTMVVGKSNATPLPKKQEIFIYDFKDEIFLQIFSFLKTVEVLNVAQVCKFMLFRVDTLFGIESHLLKPDWGERPTSSDKNNERTTTATVAIADQQTNQSNDSVVPSSSLSVLSPSTSTSVLSSLIMGNGIATENGLTENSTKQQSDAAPILTKEIVDILIKKLTASELKLIMSIAEKSKKQYAQLEAVKADNEDLNARLENTESVRNFLIENLKKAELEIKSLMSSSSSLKKQIASDQEIIAYLDLKGHELEGQKLDLSNRCYQLQASLDLQTGSHSHQEQQLSSELSDIKLKYEKLDVNSKSQKKLLVKEVKSLRAQVEQLTNERNVHASQLKLLREALNFTPTK